MGTLDPRINDLEISFGMPSWVFWGVGLPWLTTMLISIGFALVGIQDDDLGVMESALDQSPHEMTSGVTLSWTSAKILRPARLVVLQMTRL